MYNEYYRSKSEACAKSAAAAVVTGIAGIGISVMKCDDKIMLCATCILIGFGTGAIALVEGTRAAYFNSAIVRKEKRKV